MNQPQCKLVFISESCRIKDKDQLLCINKQIKKLIVLLIIALAIPLSAKASMGCHGRFVNPISDICWRCVLPISIGSFSLGDGALPAKRDTKNPKNPVCMCIKGTPPLPVPGISLGFWEPVRLVDVTRTPYCLTSLAGLSVGPVDARKISSYNRSYSKKRITHNSFYHVHYYVYPLIWWLELITDLICLEQTQFDLAYLSELDPTWNDHKLQTLFNPEAFLFGNPIAQAACAVDCAAATLNKPLDNCFWCAGCWGSMYPLSGANADHVGGVQASSLYASRIIARMHRVGLAKSTSTSNGSVDGPLCRKDIALNIKKSQYKLQMVYPSVTNNIGCWPIGLTDGLYSSFREYPHDGSDWAYIIWRKRNCCAF